MFETVFTTSTAIYVWSLLESYRMRIKRISIEDSKIPASFDGKTILFISDVHHGSNFSTKRVKALVKSINHISPDILIFGGDYITSNPETIAPVFREFKKIKSEIKKFGVLGNHDYYTDANLVLRHMKKSGINILENRGYWVTEKDERIRIGGIADVSANLSQDIAPAMEGVTKDDFVVIATHNPETINLVDIKGSDVVLCGHTHGGQFAPVAVPITGVAQKIMNSRFASQKMKDFSKIHLTSTIRRDDGVVPKRSRLKKGDVDVFITNGVGTVLAPLRFFAPPEIMLLELKASENNQN